MMISTICRQVTIAGIFFAAFVCGCEQQAKQEKQIKPAAAAKPAPAKKGQYKIALTPKQGEQAKYKIAAAQRRSINWEGPVPKKDAFEPSFNEEKVEMVVSEQIKSVNSDGKFVAQVTIDSLKYASVLKNFTTVDFDSSRKADADNSLNKLIGQSYTIEFKPDNTITSIADLNAIKAIFTGTSSSDRAANNILLYDSVVDRHSMLPLPPADKDMLNPSDTWTKNKSFAFGLMGVKSYEKIYKLKAIENIAGDQVAVIEMNAIPSSEVESKFRNQQAGANFPKMFDSNEMYTGSGEVDLTKGMINKYSEILKANWIAALPPGPGDTVDSNEPVILRMSAVRSYELEMIK